MIQLICDNSDVITKVTLAPEHNAPEHIQRLKQAGITVAIGHSNATYSQARKGLNQALPLPLIYLMLCRQWKVASPVSSGLFTIHLVYIRVLLLTAPC